MASPIGSASLWLVSFISILCGLWKTKCSVERDTSSISWLVPTHICAKFSQRNRTSQWSSREIGLSVPTNLSSIFYSMSFDEVSLNGSRDVGEVPKGLKDVRSRKSRMDYRGSELEKEHALVAVKLLLVCLSSLCLGGRRMDSLRS